MSDESPNGLWVPVLHAHLPFVKHPELDEALEERWFFEAVAESYIPLLIRLESLAAEGAYFRLTVSLSPPLLEMFADDLLMRKCRAYIGRAVELAGREKKRLEGNREFIRLAGFYEDRYRSVNEFLFGALNGDITDGFRRLMKSGSIELITSCATHGFLPLLQSSPASVNAQVSVAVDTYLRYFGTHPQGIWLPECGYYPGLEDTLKRFGIEYFFVDTHGLTAGVPEPAFGIYSPVFTENGTAVFGRDPDSSRQVWSSSEGYPGDPFYRDFYRDIGYDLDPGYIGPFILPGGIRSFTGFKYYRVTGKGDKKLPYDRELAVDRAKQHSGHFCGERLAVADKLRQGMGRPPVIVSPYDAELFGHWWYEGPEFLYFTFRAMHEAGRIQAVTASEYLDRNEELQVIAPAASSWGEGGYFDTWLNRDNDGIYRDMHHMASRLSKLAGIYYETDEGNTVRILNQLARELLLFQSSDWAFLISSDSARQYAEKRIEEHTSNFWRLEQYIDSGEADMRFLKSLEEKNSIFHDIDFRVFADVSR